MMYHQTPFVLLLISRVAVCLQTPGLVPSILADTNRDGIVNDLDAHDKQVWTADRGAMFLPNIGDTPGRCPVFDATGSPLSNTELSACHDASGDRLLSPRHAAPLLTMPLSSLPEDAVGSVFADTDRVRIFWKHGGVGANMTDSYRPMSDEWALVGPQLLFNATSLRSGIQLAIDGRELVTDASVWNGAVKVTFQVTAGSKTSQDFVVLRQAPVLLHHHLQAPETVLSIRAAPGDRWQAHFVDQLEAAVPKDTPLVLFDQGADIWAQDFFEPAYASMPGGPDGPVSIRVLLRSAQSTRSAGRQTFSQLRGPGVGVFQPDAAKGGFGFEEINSGGNIETIPPYTSRSGKKWPNGRVVMGRHFGRKPAEPMVTFLQSQGEELGQSPLFLETGWLAIGHVDEMVQFLPFDGNELGFTVAVADTRSGVEILRKAAADGQGDVRAVSYDGDTTPDGLTVFLDEALVHNTTVADLLADGSFVEINRYAQEFIDKNLKDLLDEIPLAEGDVIRVPTLFADSTYPWPATPDGLPRRLELARQGNKQATSLFPSCINGLVLGRGYIAPRPWGPVVGGEDVLARAVVDVYARANMSVSFIDDYMTHHVRGGEVHCGTNTLRVIT